MSASIKRLVESRDFRYRKGGVVLSDHCKVVLPPVFVEGVSGGSYKATLDAENGVGKGCHVWRCDDRLFILWGIMHGLNAAFFCKLEPASHVSLADYLDTSVIGASQFAKHKHSIRAKVSHIDSVKGTLVYVSAHLANAWHAGDNRKTYKVDEISYVFDLSSGAMKIMSRKDTTKDELL